MPVLLERGEKQENRQKMEEKKAFAFERNSKRVSAGQNKLRLTLTKELEWLMLAVGIAMPPFSFGNASHARHTLSCETAREHS